MIDPILEAADGDNPAAEYIVASALESAGEANEASRWYHRAADQGYRPALERLGGFTIPPHRPEHPDFSDRFWEFLQRTLGMGIGIS